MIESNYHTHSKFCDGIGQLEEYVQSALDKGMTSLGFSSHAPLPFATEWAMRQEDLPVYEESVSQLKRDYADRLAIFLGFEIDYYPGILSPPSPEIRRMNLDYTIGSVHFIGKLPNDAWWTVDSLPTIFEAGLQTSFGGNIRQAVEKYYSHMQMMVRSSPPDIIAHFDLIKRNNQANRYFSENDGWYRTLVATTLDVIAHSECILEVNTGGITDISPGMRYPSEWILEECVRRHIPITVSSDAHYPENITKYFEETSRLLQHIGFRSIRVLTHDGWVNAQL